jgi:DNA-binding helix-hairpin-helix protein with protein kinase domain
MTALFDRHGSVVRLGTELGRGGEGAVYELPGQPDLVAKRYHEIPHAAKQAKLRLMAEHIDSPLREYAAWPEDTLHLGANGPVVGFTMQRIEQRLPIHMLYSPAQRRESFPTVRYDFLVHVARNIAAAFATLHAHGHVLGDVNQGNVLVGEDGRAILIDCDSFQIQVGDALHRCEVGVAHFTPPELQSIPSFEDVTRSTDHDGFGLALLVFHLLMGGRHPYSGVPLSAEVGESLEADIRDHRYAFARDAAARRTSAPPKSVPIDSLSPDIVALFEQAFTEAGANGRPSATQWVTALDAMRATLRNCDARPAHVFAGHLEACPWCALERRKVHLFGDAPTRAAVLPATEDSALSRLDVDAMEASVARLGLPEPLALPSLPDLPAVQSSDLASREVRPQDFGVFLGAVLAVAWAVATESGRTAIPLALAFTFMLLSRFSSAGNTGSADYVYYKRQYDRALFDAHNKMVALNRQIGGAELAAWRAARGELMAFNARERALVSDHQALQLFADARGYLATQRIDRLSDPRITPGRVQLLAEYGVVTAADVERTNLSKLGALTADTRTALLEWKQRLVEQFRHRRDAPTDPKQIAEQRQRRERRALLEGEVSATHQRLMQLPKREPLTEAQQREWEKLKGALVLRYENCRTALNQ